MSPSQFSYPDSLIDCVQTFHTQRLPTLIKPQLRVDIFFNSYDKIVIDQKTVVYVSSKKIYFNKVAEDLDYRTLLRHPPNLMNKFKAID